MAGPFNLNPLLPLRRPRLDRSLTFRRRTDRLRRNPEANPVEPRVPGTRDQIVAPRRRTDPRKEALRKELAKIGDEIDKLQGEVDSTLRLDGDPIKRGRIRELLKRSDKLLSQLFAKQLFTKRA